jgi:hypothetical protein
LRRNKSGKFNSPLSLSSFPVIIKRNPALVVVLLRTSGWGNESPGRASKNEIIEIITFGGRRFNSSLENIHPSDTA